MSNSREITLIWIYAKLATFAKRLISSIILIASFKQSHWTTGVYNDLTLAPKSTDHLSRYWMTCQDPAMVLTNLINCIYHSLTFTDTENACCYHVDVQKLSLRRDFCNHIRGFKCCKCWDWLKWLKADWLKI